MTTYKDFVGELTVNYRRTKKTDRTNKTLTSRRRFYKAIF